MSGAATDRTGVEVVAAFTLRKERESGSSRAGSWERRLDGPFYVPCVRLPRSLRRARWSRERTVPVSAAPALEDLTVMRIVVRNGFTHDLAEMFLTDFSDLVDWLTTLDRPLPHQPQAGPLFHH